MAYELVGRLFKRRGGLGKHAKLPWQPRTFALTADGVLSYFDGDDVREKPRQSLDLRKAAATLTDEAAEDAPTAFSLTLTPDHGPRWRLCAETKATLDCWRGSIAKHCRASDHGAPAAGAAVRAAKRAPPRRAASTKPLQLAPPLRLASTHVHVSPRPRLRGAKLPAVALSVAAAVDACAVLTVCVSWALLGAAVLLLHVYVGVGLARAVDAEKGDAEAAVSLVVPPTKLPSLGAAKAVAAAAPGAVAHDARLRKEPFIDGVARPAGTWSRAPAESFKIRQVGYLKSKRKAPSTEALYDVLSVDLLDTELRLNDVTQSVFKLPEGVEPSPDEHVPATFLINAQIPGETGPLRVKLDADGPGYQVVICMQLSAATRRDLLALKNDEHAPLTPQRKAALKLLKTYCALAPLEPQLEPKERGRFKVLAQIRNIDEVNIPNFAKGYNGKPALIAKTGTLTRGPNNSHLELDINVHAFGYMARAGLQSIFRDFEDFILSVGFVLEGRADDELPEVMLCSFDFNHVTWTMAAQL
ncbi:hypothetical protein M885DRAFT_537231 [Pelagophyceae sp. CCMP2097]|nr:hypothetical protein M885DRAFT_537231 [Pelagophyceae sp. CCMP2097]